MDIEAEAGQASKIKALTLAEMAKRYEAGALDPQVGQAAAAA
jgi:fructose-bisphosphate aldolase class II